MNKKDNIIIYIYINTYVIYKHKYYFEFFVIFFP